MLKRVLPIVVCSLEANEHGKAMDADNVKTPSLEGKYEV